jgi:hypothetical protein
MPRLVIHKLLCARVLSLMPAQEQPLDVYKLRRIERMAALPHDAGSIERVLAYEQQCGPAHRHRTMLIRRWGRSVGLEPYEP